MGLSLDIQNRLAAAEPAMRELLRRCIRFPSVSGAEREFTEFIAGWAKRAGFEVDLWQADESVLGDFFTTPQDLVREPMSFVCRPPNIVFESSGTSGKNKQVYYGRDELIVASGGNLYPLMFEKILQLVRGLAHDWQIVFKLEGVREILEINVESDRKDSEAIEAEIHRSATELYPDLMKNLGIGIFDMRLVVHSPGTLRTARKLKRMVDQRHFQPITEVTEPVAV